MPAKTPPPIPGLGGVERFLDRREAEDLQKALEPGEKVRAAASGKLGRSHGLLAATTHRILFVSRGVKVHVKSWGYARVERVHAEVDLDEAAITLHADNQVFVVSGVPRKAAQHFADTIRQTAPKSQFRRVVLVRDPKKATSAAGGVPRQVEERLARLRAQLEKGALTEPEFRANRRRILEEAGLPTDLALGLSTRAPIREPDEPEPAGEERPWPDRGAARDVGVSDSDKAWPKEPRKPRGKHGADAWPEHDV